MGRTRFVCKLHREGGLGESGVILSSDWVALAAQFTGPGLAIRVASAVGSNSFPLTEPIAEVSDNAHRFRPGADDTHIVLLSRSPGRSPEAPERPMRPARIRAQGLGARKKATSADDLIRVVLIQCQIENSH